MPWGWHNALKQTWGPRSWHMRASRVSVPGISQSNDHFFFEAQAPNRCSSSSGRDANLIWTRIGSWLENLSNSASNAKLSNSNTSLIVQFQMTIQIVRQSDDSISFHNKLSCKLRLPEKVHPPEFAHQGASIFTCTDWAHTFLGIIPSISQFDP